MLLLPHGYEGQGPEHSSARLERFLQACAEDNIQVCNLTTAAQYFHVLRRQMKRDFVKPLIIMTPKSLLRSEQASSRTEDFTTGSFAEILGAPEVAPPEKIERVILCSGKVYFDLLNYRAAEKITNAAIVRVEQLYPFAEEKLRAVLNPFRQAQKFVWCQEESQNMGAWTYIEPRLRALARPGNSLCRAQCQREPGGRGSRVAQARAGLCHRGGFCYLRKDDQRRRGRTVGPRSRAAPATARPLKLC